MQTAINRHWSFLIPFYRHIELVMHAREVACPLPSYPGVAKAFTACLVQHAAEWISLPRLSDQSLTLSPIYDLPETHLVGRVPESFPHLERYTRSIPCHR